MEKTLEIAAVQMCAELGAVEQNLRVANALASQAFRSGAQWVILPEFFTSAMAFDPRMAAAWMPLHGAALAMMRELAHSHDGVVGGSFVARDGHDCYNSFLLVFPDGRYWRHDKDLPTMVENCYYVGGEDDGILETPVGPVGAAVCWEFIRTQTMRRLKDRVEFVVGGTCWWDFAQPVDPRFEMDRQRLIEIQREAPSHMARMLGVPVVHASHAGEFVAQTPGKAEVPFRSHYLGQTQIVDARGDVLARMTREDGEGFVRAQIEIQPRLPASKAIPESFWACELTAGALTAWERQNAFGKAYYESVTRPSLQAGA